MIEPLTRPARWHLPARTGATVIPTSAGVGLALSALPLAWWAVGSSSTGDEHDFGPFLIPLPVLLTIGVLGILVAAACVIAILRASAGPRPARAGLAPSATTLAVLTAVLTAAGGRAATAGSDGANIGGGIILLAGPLLVAGLLIGAVITQRAWRPKRAWHTATLIVAAALTAPAMWGGEVLAEAHAAPPPGDISQASYNHVTAGDSRAVVRHHLGKGIGDVGFNELFGPRPAQPADTTCDYYDTTGARGRLVRLCYRNGLLVAKQAAPERD